MFERIDEIADRFEARLSLFEKRIRRALRLRALIVFVPVAVLAISVNLFTYLTQKIVSFKNNVYELKEANAIKLSISR